MSPLTAAEARSVEDHMPLVNVAVSRLMRRIPAWVDGADLRSAGVLALIDALRRYKHESGVPFGCYASIRIRGALIDELRRAPGYSRNGKIATFIPLDAPREDGTVSVGDTLADTGDITGRQAMEQLERVQSVRRELENLPDAERRAVSMYYFKGMTVDQIGVVFRRTDVRISQILQRARARMRIRISRAA